MNAHTHITRWISTGLLATAVLALAVPAFADSGRRRHKGVQNNRQVQRVIVRDRSSSVGPALAGLIGGFILGTAVSANARPVVVHDRPYRRASVDYRYYDPYGDNWFDSLDECEFNHRGPRIIQVIEVRSGRHIRSLRYGNGRWNQYDDDRNQGYYNRGDDDDRGRGYNNRDDRGDD